MLLEDWLCEDGLRGTGGVAGLFGTEAVGTKVRGLGGGVGCFPLDTGGVCHDPAPIFHFPPPPQVIPTTPSPPVTQPACAQQTPV